MNPEQIQQLQEQEAVMRTQLNQEQIGQAQAQMSNEQMNVGMIKEQLNLDEEVKRIENLLRGRYLSKDDFGKDVWVEPETNENRLLTNAGIQFILNSISWYLNKNTLLSNYDEETILGKMEDYSESLNDILFMRSEIYFLKPTLKECKIILEKRITDRIDKTIVYMELRGEEGDSIQIRKDIIKEMDIERELDKIKENEVRDKLKGFEHLIRVIQDTIHSCYNRAWKGGERGSIRKSMHVSESISPVVPQQKGGANPFSWFKK